jgi:hypothetical protein
MPQVLRKFARSKVRELPSETEEADENGMSRISESLSFRRLGYQGGIVGLPEPRIQTGAFLQMNQVVPELRK